MRTIVLAGAVGMLLCLPLAAPSTAAEGDPAGVASTAAPTPSPTTPSSPVATPSASGTDAQSSTRLLLVLDGSRSMRGKDPGGGTRIEAAKKALTTMVDQLPDSAVVGLRVYGATASSKDPRTTQCTDSQLTVPVGPLDRDAMKTSIGGFTGQAATPIGYALQEGAKDLGDTGKRNIVLVSDGRSNCSPPPCPTVRTLVRGGVSIQVDTVGYGLGTEDDAARSDLQCIADETGGTYYDAKDADALNASLVRISQRALRPYSFSGTPVDGADAYDQAPEIGPGQYLDTYTKDQGTRYYAIKRTPGSTLSFALTNLARDGADDDEYVSEGYEVELQTPDAQTCESARLGSSRLNYRSRLAVGADALTIVGPDPADVASSSSSYSSAISSSSSSWSSSTSQDAASASSAGSPAPTPSPLSPSPSPTDSDACRTSDRIIAAVDRVDDETDEAQVELLVTEEPAAPDALSLPEAQDEQAPALVPATTPEQPVVGGPSFTTATEISPGTYTDALLPGEQVFYKIKADHGQQPVITVDIPAPGTRLTPDVTTAVDLKAWSPTRRWLEMNFPDPPVSDSVSEGDRVVLHRYAPRVRYRNHWASGSSGAISSSVVRASGQPGYYYFSLTAGAYSPDDEGLQGPVAVRLRAAVDGQVEAGPAPVVDESADGGGEGATGERADGSDDGISSGTIVLVGGLVAMLGAAGVLAALVIGRRRR